VASLHLIRHSIGSQWSCLRSSVDVDEEDPERCCVTTLASAVYKFKSSKASKARLQSSKHTGAKQNLTQNGHLRSFKVTCFGVERRSGTK